MKLDIIDNRGTNNLRNTLISQLVSVSDASIAVAFVTQAGLAEILQPLRQAATKGRVRLLTGLYHYFTQPEALETLLGVQRENPGRFSIRLSLEERFHQKFYLLNNRTRCSAIVGSSNLTGEGLTSGGERNLLVRLPTSSPPAKKMALAFDEDWEHRAVPLTKGRVVEYEQARPKTPPRESPTRGQLEKILGVPPLHEHAPKHAGTAARSCEGPWLYPISARANRHFLLKDGSKPLATLQNYRDLVHDERIVEDRYWGISQNWTHVKYGDEVFIYTGDYDQGIIGYATVADVTYRRGRWRLELDINQARCRTLLQEEHKIPAVMVRRWVFPRRAVTSLAPFQGELRALLPW